MQAGLILRLLNKSFVADVPACMAAFNMTSEPGKPTFAAKRGNSGQGTRLFTRTLFRAKNMLPPGLANAGMPGAARAVQKVRLENKGAIASLSIISESRIRQGDGMKPSLLSGALSRRDLLTTG